MNPARAFATQILEWQWTDAWIYYVARSSAAASRR